MPISNFTQTKLSTTTMTMSTLHWQRWWYFCSHTFNNFMSSFMSLPPSSLHISFCCRSSSHSICIHYHLDTFSQQQHQKNTHFRNVFLPGRIFHIFCSLPDRLCAGKTSIRLGRKVFTSDGFSIWIAEWKSNNQPNKRARHSAIYT